VVDKRVSPGMGHVEGVVFRGPWRRCSDGGPLDMSPVGTNVY
jgi:hypothetical protein